MILPDKIRTFRHSLLGTGSLILRHLSHGETVSSLWEKVKNYDEINTFTKFVLTLDFLYALNLIDFKDGLIIRRERHDSKKG